MLYKLTDRARAVMRQAREEASSFGKCYLGTEHLLAALLKDKNSSVFKVLNDLGVTYEEVVQEICEVTGAQRDSEVLRSLAETVLHDTIIIVRNGKLLRTTPRYREAVKEGSESAKEQGKTYISTTHLMLGIIKSGGVAMDILRKMGVSDAALRKSLYETIKNENTDETEDDNGAGPGGMPNRESSMRDDRYAEVSMTGRSGRDNDKRSMLARYGRNLTDLAAEGQLDPVIGREREIERMMQILARRQKNNPLILGDPGVGKTAVVEGLAQRMHSGDVPDILRNRRLWMLDLPGLLAGTKYRGEFEDRLKRVVDEVQSSNGDILFIDELHTVIGAGAAEGSIDASAILKPPLARGEIQIIGATTAEEFRRHIEKDSAFERRFQPVEVGEPTHDQAVQILEGLRERYEKHHNVRYTDEALRAAVSLSARYVQDRFLPDKAIDVIDEAGARKRVHGSNRPDELAEVDAKLEEIHAKKRDAVASQEFEEAARLRDEQIALLARRDEIEKNWKQQTAAEVATVDEEAVAEIVAHMTGVPVTSVTEGEATKLLRCEDALHERVIGQDEAVTKVARAIRRSRSPLKDPRRPGGSLMFLGPSGVGKTELAKSLAEFLFGTEDALISFDMSEYMERHDVSKLTGAPPGYIGFEKAGELTKAVRRRPYSVLLFDEVEKAHPDVFNVLLQILEEGRLTDAQGRTVDFANTVVILTSNIGARDIAQTTTMGFSAQGAAGLSDKEITSRVMGELKRHFRPEFLNRVDEIVVFKSLTSEDLRGIVDLMVAELRQRLATQGMSIELTDAACEKIATEGKDPVYGARPLRRALQSLVEDPLSEHLLEGRWKAGDVILVDVDAEGEGCVFSRTEGEIPEVAPQDDSSGSLYTPSSPADYRPSRGGGSLSSGA